MSSFVFCEQTTHPLIHKTCVCALTSVQVRGMALSSKQRKLGRKKVDKRNKNEGLYI